MSFCHVALFSLVLYQFIETRLLYHGLGLGPWHLVHWTQLDGDTCPKVDTCHHFNRSITTGY